MLDNTYFDYECDYGRDSGIIIERDGSEIDLTESFPTRWFWEDFEEEIIRGRATQINEESLAIEAKEAKERLRIAEIKRKAVYKAKKLLREEGYVIK